MHASSIILITTAQGAGFILDHDFNLTEHFSALQCTMSQKLEGEALASQYKVSRQQQPIEMHCLHVSLPEL